jgi:hypothetical protein
MLTTDTGDKAGLRAVSSTVAGVNGQIVTVHLGSTRSRPRRAGAGLPAPGTDARVRALGQGGAGFDEGGDDLLDVLGGVGGR